MLSSNSPSLDAPKVDNPLSRLFALGWEDDGSLKEDAVRVGGGWGAGEGGRYASDECEGECRDRQKEARGAAPCKLLSLPIRLYPHRPHITTTVVCSPTSRMPRCPLPPPVPHPQLPPCWVQLLPCRVNSSPHTTSSAAPPAPTVCVCVGVCVRACVMQNLISSLACLPCAVCMRYRTGCPWLWTTMPRSWCRS